ncbi:hypothetical protein OXPF_14930 [Oxobacter pfennigii]|uniref:Uncharacterized protein n=1 Tax=Oxobacter pfennigii TaxID=36849 RepID=A0A0P9AHS8_9CLOT|nr:DUF523 domain-containing protein [Oxobacter pfennigii]KPU45015.1 hypothetical protein OXPF_14930 [Oxobacter pfennigii]
MILVSSCLLGLDTKYNGTSNCNDLLLKYSHLEKYIPICPEQLGGLPTPREAAEIKAGTGEDVIKGHAKVITVKGEDCTYYFVKGAKEVLKLAKMLPVSAAILKEKSPSCGCNEIYDGTFANSLIRGAGVTAELLRQNGIRVYSENEVTDKLLQSLLCL